ncbi:hypothetical protein RhiirC2_863050 [Rhizophagus irregularis]|uniref:Uncharacterized protein n=1 Tax=Rhizophagus irregularis TaxID=588596 RepID=A0A2N1NPB5_9GLOM|nr:hypothetical protein RhiirC2_863050 [Rhizophagus irregularis]
MNGNYFIKVLILNCKGKRWLYQYIDNDLDKDGSHRENFVPGVHSSQWFIYEGIVLLLLKYYVCEITRGDFNGKLKNLNKTCYYNRDDIGVIVGSNENENKIVSKPQNIQNWDDLDDLVGKIDRSLGLK